MGEECARTPRHEIIAITTHSSSRLLSYYYDCRKVSLLIRANALPSFSLDSLTQLNPDHEDSIGTAKAKQKYRTFCLIVPLLFSALLKAMLIVTSLIPAAYPHHTAYRAYTKQQGNGTASTRGRCGCVDGVVFVCGLLV